MNKAQAIKKYCIECAGSSYQVSRCLITDCPLWAYRFGYSMKDKRYKKRMDIVKKAYPNEPWELLEGKTEAKSS